MYADADGTYMPSDAVKLLSEVKRSGADLVMGTRLKGTIEDGAMPLLHRYLGTPLLSFFIRILYKIPITDCNSGIRGLRREAYRSWDLSEPGMEFASSMLIHAAISGAKVREVPVTLRRCREDRVPHLKTWMDGMRHLLTVFAGAPGLFWSVGCALLGYSLLLMLPSLWGPIEISRGIRFFGMHTQAISIVAGFYGATFVSLALPLYGKQKEKSKIPRLVNLLTALREDFLFFGLLGFFAVFVLGGAYSVWQWSRIHYANFEFIKFTLALIYFTIVPSTLILGVFRFHLQKRAWV